MRLLSLACVAALAVATPGCTVPGAGTGALVAVSANDYSGRAPDDRASVGTYALVGAGLGLLADYIVVSKVIDSLNHMRLN